MSETLSNFLHDHEEIAWSHFLAQFVDKDSLEGFVRAFYVPINILDKALNDLLTKRWLETAEGVQLDGIGNIVGVSRISEGSVFLEFFGFQSQVSGRAFGVARIRHDREPYTASAIIGDTDYRLLIERKIWYNNARGTIEEIRKAVNLNTGEDDAVVAESGNATVTVTIGHIATSDPRYPFLEYMVPVAYGVRLVWNILP